MAATSLLPRAPLAHLLRCAPVATWCLVALTLLGGFGMMMNTRFDGIDERLDRIDNRFDGRLDRMEERFNQIEERQEERFNRIEARPDQLLQQPGQ